MTKNKIAGKPRVNSKRAKGRVKRESDDDESGSEEELAQDTIYENRKKKETSAPVEKKTMDSFLKKFD